MLRQQKARAAYHSLSSLHQRRTFQPAQHRYQSPRAQTKKRSHQRAARTPMLLLRASQHHQVIQRSCTPLGTPAAAAASKTATMPLDLHNFIAHLLRSCTRRHRATVLFQTHRLHSQCTAEDCSFQQHLQRAHLLMCTIFHCLALAQLKALLHPRSPNLCPCWTTAASRPLHHVV